MPYSDRLLVLGADAGVLAFSAKARPEIFLVERKDRIKPEQLQWCKECLIADYRAVEEIHPLVAAAHAARPFAQVYSPTEPGLLPAARLNELLGLGGTSVNAVTLLKDKAQMRKRLRENNLSVVRFAVGASKTDIAEFSAYLAGPMIVKPLDSSGSFGVFRLDYPHSGLAVQKLFEKLEARGLKEFLMEEFLAGTEVSVESFSFHGRHILLACTKKFIAHNFVEIGHVAPAHLDPRTHRLLAELVPRFLDLMGIKDGPCHTEVMLTERGPYIVESHNRTGGDHIPQLVEMAVGVQLFELAFGWPIGRVTALESAPETRGAGAVRFFWPSPGRVVSVQGMEQAAKMPGVEDIHLKVGVGDEVPVVQRSADRVGFISARGKTPEEALDRCMKAMRKVKIETSAEELAAGQALGVAS